MKISNRTEIKFQTSITLTEGEARALCAIAGYGVESFLDVFCDKLGSFYLNPYKEDFRELITKIKLDLSPEVKRIDELRKKI